MNIRLPLHILSAATVLLFAATACTQDDLGGSTLPEGEYPLVINATGLQVVATPASRATVDGDWQDVQAVALSVGGTVKQYDVTASDADGYKTATLISDTDPFWWTSRADITVSAWWPYGTTMPDVVVKADQSTKAGFEGSDFISAEAQTVQFDSPTLEFSHRTARITVLLKPGDGIPSVTGADVSVTGLGTDNGNPATIRTYAAGSDTYEALAAPQTVKANTPFIQVDLGGGTYYFRPQSDVVLAAGSRYTYTVNVNATGLTLEGCTIGGWTDGGSESGTAEDLGYFIQDDGSYTAYTANGLKEWAEAVQTDPTINCTLTADIDLTGETWTPIGSGFGPDNGYQGTFDGQGHSITGLTITTNTTDGEHAALFDGIGSDGTVKNLQVEVNYTVQQNGAAGGIAYANYGTITACSVKGDITANSGAVGGIAVGNLDTGIITACWYNGQLKERNIGGIVSNNNNTVTACYWGGNAGQGVNNNMGGTVDATKVEGTITWQDAVEGMNAALTGNDYQWKLGTDGLPVLQSNQ
ncbi:fimbrillin family protein [Phocaeicola plebeius]|uniref:fimbrillin family protein n=1 Tax=Phocaeicola plebeius TaxID=310297 RepID=UPI00307F8C5C